MTQADDGQDSQGGKDGRAFGCHAAQAAVNAAAGWIEFSEHLAEYAAQAERRVDDAPRQPGRDGSARA